MHPVDSGKFEHDSLEGNCVLQHVSFWFEKVS